MSKRRIDGEKVESTHVIGDVEGKNIVMVDDIISTASTMIDAAKLLKKKGCKNITVVATHGLFCGGAIENIRKSPIDKIIISDTIQLSRAMQQVGDDFPKIEIISISSLLGEAIRREYLKTQLSSLLQV